jgi:hypothetical protein
MQHAIRLTLLASTLLMAACGGGSSSNPQTPAVSVVAPVPEAPVTVPQVVPELTPDAAGLGANLPAVYDWTRTPMFVDLINQARRFGQPSTPWDENATLGADGWPVGDFGVVLMSGQEGVSGNDGVYKVSFDGQATVRVESSDASISNLVYDAARKRTTLDVTLVDGVYHYNLMLSFNNTGTGIKNLKVIRPGYDANAAPLFTKAFLDHIARFKTVRLMDWLRTNNNTVTSWATRTTPDNTHFASPSGVPWEHIVALANQANKDIWINIPLRADDDYVAQLAKLLKSSLNPTNKIYIEYSNELWNYSFSQFGTNRDLANNEVVANPASTLAYDHTSDTTLIAFRRIARRGKEISDIFRSVYGDSAMMNTVRPVLAGQIVQPYITTVGLQFIDAVYGPPSNYFYAVAGAPYLNLDTQQTTDGLSTDQVLQALGSSLASMPVTDSFESNLAASSWYGLHFIAYEGGFDTFGAGSLAAKKAASLDPRLLDLCTNYLTSWYASGGGLFMWFTAGAGNWDTQYGTWELTTDLARTDTPKLKCMDSVLAAPRPALVGRNTIPTTLSALAYAGNLPPYSAQSAMATRYLHKGSSLDYLLNVPASGSYTLVINAEAEKAGNKINVAVNGKAMISGFEMAVTGLGTLADNRPITLNLVKGFNTLRLTTQAETSGYALSTLTIR